ncbi:hypothetical protein V6N12_018458 [Hibiscus sabdariffa]|uniref:RRM domain-containing protein n=1 Tax=Hibiscus sabdariffa TaxID=183260 RepID=A0ABR2BQS6_9ROSI
MYRVYVGNLDPRVSERELEDEFRVFGVIRSVWVARRPPGYAFIDFDDHRDAEDAIRELDGKNGWRVEHSHNSRGRENAAREVVQEDVAAVALDIVGAQVRGAEVTVLVDNPLDVAVPLLVGAATAGLHCTVVVRNCHILMGEPS